MNDSSMSTREVAQFLGKSPHWVQMNAKRLGIPRYRLGGRWVYLRAEVTEWFLSTKEIQGAVHTVSSKKLIKL